MAEQIATTSMTTTASTPTMDPNHPNHLHASDSPDTTLVNTPFDGKGYSGWKRSVLIALSAKNKLGFITGYHPCPASDSTDFQAWNRCNDMVTSWILNSLSKDIADSVIYSKTVQELWIILEHKFGQSNGAKLYHLQKELNNLNQGTNSKAGYFTRLKKLWDELNSLNSNIQCSCVCMCEGKLKLKKSLEDERLIQFLMGLNDTYSQARSNILMINPLPNINLAYSLILHDESQRESYFNPVSSADSSAFMTRNINNQKTAKQTQKFIPLAPHRSGNFYPRSAPPQVQQQRFTKQLSNLKETKEKYNPNVSCDYCGKQGHLDGE
ncbi:hypothetical protein P3S67_026355 [Capsicum chacoense]